MTRSEIIATLNQKYPNFSKITMCMVLHPERYGVCLTSEASTYIQEIYPDIEPPYIPKKRHKKKAPAKRKKGNRLSFYVDDDELAHVKAAAEEAGCKTMQEYLSTLIH